MILVKNMVDNLHHLSFHYLKKGSNLATKQFIHTDIIQMKVEQKGHTTTIRNTQGNTADFLTKVVHEYNSYKTQNIILDLTHDKNLNMQDIKSFIDLSKKHKKEKKSLVLVTDAIDFNAVPTTVTVVPTLLEAHDIIEMEEIERDLGF
jgi:hypothetical protein